MWIVIPHDKKASKIIKASTSSSFLSLSVFSLGLDPQDQIFLISEQKSKSE